MEHYCNVLHEIYPSGLSKGKYTINYTKCLLFDINQTSILFKKENTKVEQSGSEHLYVSSKIGITLQRQLSLGSPKIQTLYLCYQFYSKNVRMFRFHVFFHFYHGSFLYDAIILFEVDRIHKKL